MSALGANMILKILFFVCFLNLFLLTGSDQLRAQTLTLENEYLYIEFQQSLPAVDRYVLKSNNQVIYGHVGYSSYGHRSFMKVVSISSIRMSIASLREATAFATI